MNKDIAGITRATIEALVPIRGVRVLEIGCGDGRITGQLAPEPSLLAGVEPCADQAAIAGRIEGACIAAAAAEHLPFADNAFDTVLFTLSLHHAESAKALEEAARVTRPGGSIIAVEPHPHGTVQLLSHIFEDEGWRLERGRRALDDSEALAAAGMRVVLERAFTAHWEFADFQELCDYQFEHYNMPRSEELVQTMLDFLGPDCTGQRPIILEDLLVAAVLDV